MGNEPPVLTFAAGGAKFNGTADGVAASFNGAADQPVPISVLAEDVKEEEGRRPPTWPRVSFHKYRGPGDVKFEQRAHPGAEGGRGGHARRRRSPRPANTCCACRRTTNRAKAAAVFSVAGPIPTSKWSLSDFASEWKDSYDARIRCGSFGRCSSAAACSCASQRGHGANRAAPTFTKDIAPIFQEKCEACHRPDSIAPMSLVTYAEARPWARSIRARVADHTDAAVEHRQDRRRAEVQERSLARRQADRHDREVGRRRRAAGQPEGHAGGEDLARGSGLELRGAVRPEGAGPDHQVVRLHHAGAVAGRVGQARHAVGHHRAALGARRSRFARRRSRAARSRITRSRISSRPTRARRRRLACRRRSWNGRSASRAS